MISIIEDTRQQTGKHNHKRQWFEEHGITITRSKLPFGDYAIMPTMAIDTKRNMDEIAANICGKEHTRFINECKAAKAAGCQLVILVENTDGIEDVSAVHTWENPRRFISPYCVEGPRLQKAMKTISERYGVKFMFCRPEQAAERITEMLTHE